LLKANDGTYGYRRMHAALARGGDQAGPELVRQLMRELGLVSCQPGPWRPSTTQQGAAGPIPDLVNRDFSADVPGAKMVGDITYIPTWQGWLFLATVIDCATRKVVGWAMDDNYRTPLIALAIEMAARNVDLPPGAVFHSDRGSNYTSAEFAAVLEGLGISQSVGRTGICYEVSRRRESHPPPLSEPCLTVSRYTAPVAEPVGNAPCRQWANMPG
jgi:putative transposase